MTNFQIYLIENNPQYVNFLVSEINTDTTKYFKSVLNKYDGNPIYFNSLINGQNVDKFIFRSKYIISPTPPQSPRVPDMNIVADLYQSDDNINWILMGSISGCIPSGCYNCSISNLNIVSTDPRDATFNTSTCISSILDCGNNICSSEQTSPSPYNSQNNQSYTLLNNSLTTYIYVCEQIVSVLMRWTKRN